MHIPSDIALVEFHDARVEQVMLPMNGTCVIIFKHLPVYRARSSERFAIWSYRAALELRDVEQVLVKELWTDADYVSDGSVRHDSQVLSLHELLIEKPVSKVSMTFGSGRTVQIKCKRAQLVLSEALREIEEWVGPLA